MPIPVLKLMLLFQVGQIICALQVTLKCAIFLTNAMSYFF